MEKMTSERDTIENRTFEEIARGDKASLTRTLTRDDIDLFAVVSGDINPTHVDMDFATAAGWDEVSGHSMWTGTLISALLGTELPGPGTQYVSQSLHFRRPIKLGDTLTVRITVAGKQESLRRIELD